MSQEFLNYVKSFAYYVKDNVLTKHVSKLVKLTDIKNMRVNDRLVFSFGIFVAGVDIVEAIREEVLLTLGKEEEVQFPAGAPFGIEISTQFADSYVLLKDGSEEEVWMLCISFFEDNFSTSSNLFDGVRNRELRLAEEDEALQNALRLQSDCSVALLCQSPDGYGYDTICIYDILDKNHFSSIMYSVSSLTHCYPKTYVLSPHSITYIFDAKISGKYAVIFSTH